MVGATIGFSLVNLGQQGIYWIKLGRIVTSWFISPMIAGFISGAFFVIIRRYILETDDPIKSGLKYMPYLYGVTIFINVASLLMDGHIMVGLMEKLPWWGILLISSGLGLITTVIMGFCVPWQRKKIAKVIAPKSSESSHSHFRSRLRSLSLADLEDSETTVEESFTQGRLHLKPGTVTLNSERASWTRKTPRARRATIQRSRIGSTSLSEVERDGFLASINAENKILACTDSGLPVLDSLFAEISEQNDLITMKCNSSVSMEQPGNSKYDELISVQETNTATLETSVPETPLRQKERQSRRSWACCKKCGSAPAVKVIDKIPLRWFNPFYLRKRLKAKISGIITTMSPCAPSMFSLCSRIENSFLIQILGILLD